MFIKDDGIPLSLILEKPEGMDTCPLVKAAEGFMSVDTMPLYRDCRMMVVPVTCDCKKKIAGMLSAKREVVTLHVPVKKEDSDIELYMEELYFFMEKNTARMIPTIVFHRMVS